MRKTSHEKIVARQKEKSKIARLPFVVVLSDIRSLHNVGSIFRTCDAVGVEKLWLCGITGYPPNKQLCKTSLGAEDCVNWENAANAAEVVAKYKNKGYTIAFLEQMEGSLNYADYAGRHPVCLVVGNEVKGVDDALIPFCDVALEIEMMGIKNSLNASVAFGIVAYHLRKCLIHA
ncbi:TrmH family RNA methyltransferase [Candidatus Omnitrophota bacterium]